MADSDRHLKERWVCPKCGFKRYSKQDECPKCGVIISKLFAKDVREGLSDDALQEKYQLYSDQLKAWKDCLVFFPNTNEADTSKPSFHNEGSALSGITSRINTVWIVVGLVIAAGALVFFTKTSKREKISPQGPISTSQVPKATKQDMHQRADTVATPQKSLHEETVPRTPPQSSAQPSPRDLPPVSTAAVGDRLIAQAGEIARNYHQTHTYRAEDWFACVDMSCDIWNQLRTKGMRASLRAGSTSHDLTVYRGGKFSPQYLRNINHAWVMFQSESGEDVPLEATAGKVMKKGDHRYKHYLEGFTFDSPKRLKQFDDARKEYVKCWDELEEIGKRLETARKARQDYLLERQKQIDLYPPLERSIHFQKETTQVVTMFDAETAKIASQYKSKDSECSECRKRVLQVAR